MTEIEQELEDIIDSLVDHVRTYPDGQEGFVKGMEVAVSVAGTILHNVEDKFVVRSRLIAWEAFSQMMAATSGMVVERR